MPKAVRKRDVRMAKGREYMRKRKFKQSLKVFNEILEDDPENIVALIHKGTSRAALGRHEDALK